MPWHYLATSTCRDEGWLDVGVAGSTSPERIRSVAVRRGLRVCAFAGLVLIGALASGWLPSEDAGASDAANEVVVVDMDHTIDNVTARFLGRALDDANDRGAELVVIRLDTPGGLVSATRDMISDIFASKVPVVVYVAPEGSRAASAGTFITAAGGVAAMAPATNIGAASVVGSQGEDLPDTLQRKANEDAAALLRSIAERRDRNADLF